MYIHFIDDCVSFGILQREVSVIEAMGLYISHAGFSYYIRISDEHYETTTIVPAFYGMDTRSLYNNGDRICHNVCHTSGS